jgi:hypothetical protein
MKMATCGKVRSTGFILMARFLDRNGLPLDPRTVSRLVYSVFEIDPIQRDVRRLVVGHDKGRLDIGQVIGDSLRTDAMWAVDRIGYNFCHRIAFNTFSNSLPIPQNRYEVRYWVTLTSGDTTAVSFRLRVS